MNINPMLATDFYKLSHWEQYPKDTEYVYSNWTARSTRVPNQFTAVNFGFTYFAKEYLNRFFVENFFGVSWAQIEKEYSAVLAACLGIAKPKLKHIQALHELGYLPLRFYSIPEGQSTPLNCPQIVVVNTRPEFFWLTNFIESLMSCILWKPSTSATTAQQYRRLFEKYALESGEMDLSFVDYQGHDFSFRGMSGLEDAILSGLGHLTCFTGTDTIPAILAAQKYYGASLSCGASVPATEHSTMCAGTQDGEFSTFERLIKELYPTGIISIVSDTWDLWKVLTEYIPRLKSDIMARDGKLVIRPDSGDPILVMCGDPDSYGPAHFGTLRLLEAALGVDKNRHGLPLINKAGAIYGDSITLERANQILYRTTKELKLSPYNCVFGIGSYCVAPETKILCSDLIWRSAGSIAVGQEIMAFDENPTFQQEETQRVARRYRTAIIEENRPAIKDCFKVNTDTGSPVVASYDHPWLIYTKNRNRNSILAPSYNPPDDCPRTAGLAWKRTADLIPGDLIAYLCDPWSTEDTRESGWLAGMFDGEGSVGRYLPVGQRISAWKVNISQNNGPTLDSIRNSLRKRGFTWYENERECPQVILTGGFQGLLKFLGTIRPERLLRKLPQIMSDLPGLFRGKTYTLAEITNVESVGAQPVSSIRTSCGTFITEGYLSHNTYEYVTRDTYGRAMKATAVTRSGKLVPIFKNPITDDGGKKSHRGIPAVYQHEHSTEANPDYYVVENSDPSTLDNCAFEKVWEDGRLLVDPTFDIIRKRVRGATPVKGVAA